MDIVEPAKADQTLLPEDDALASPQGALRGSSVLKGVRVL